MKLNPFKVYRDLKETFSVFLEQFFYTKYDYINEKIKSKFKTYPFIKGLYLQNNPPYTKGRKLIELSKRGLLEPELLKVFGEDLHLYRHQEKVLERVIEKERNVIIATGTGSGKTYSFLIPVFNYILKEKKKNHRACLKAIFLYPMNALVNDQLRELRELIHTKAGGKILIDITFGRYTGDTPYDCEDFDRKQQENSNKGNKIITCQEWKRKYPNELLTREEILTQIPDILITNYSMLEYLLLRPKDSPLFENSCLKFIVIDEIHVYNGAKGAEIGYLLRRLKTRINEGNGKLICIGASATLGDNSKQTFEKVANFASNIFGEAFYPEDIITAELEEIRKPKDTWRDFSNINFVEIMKKFEDENINLESFSQFLKEINPKKTFKATDKRELLYEFFEDYEPFYRLLEYLKTGPKTLDELVDKFFPKRISKEEEYNQLVAFIELLFKACKNCNDDKRLKRLLYAKYHLFLKAPSGIYATLDDDGNIQEIFFERKRFHEDRKVYQLATCRYCGEVFIVGYTNPPQSNNRFTIEVDPYIQDPFKLERYQKSFFFIPKRNLDEYFLNLNSNSKRRGNSIPDTIYYLNPKTGEVSRNPTPEHKVKIVKLAVEKITPLNPFNQPKKCPNCGIDGRKLKKGFWISYLNPPEELPQAVILQSLYKDLTLVAEERKDKKIIVFSDSRKDAAFFASYFDNFNKETVYRWLIYDIIRKQNKITYKNLKEELLKKLIPKRKIKQSEKEEKQKEIDKFLIREFVLDYPEALERIGAIRLVLDNSVEEEILEKILSKFKNFNKDKNFWKSLLYSLLLTLRETRIIDRYSEILELDRENWYIWKNKNDSRKKDDSWIPRKRKDGTLGKSKRADIIRKAFNQNINDKDIENILSVIWDILTEVDILTYSSNKGYRLKPQEWVFEKTKEVYICQKCRRIHVWNLNNKCINRNCDGELKLVENLSEIPQKKFFIKSYEGFKSELVNNYLARVEEHTAQLSRKEAEIIQKEFEEGKVNILSCSTTFELGVNLGELQLVFLHNVPPKADNYIQRAGRAGRKAKSTPLVVTYALNRPHDEKIFSNPIPMITGKIKPPVIKLNNKRIILRHLNAIALSHFLRKNFSKAKSIVLREFLEKESFKAFVKYLNEHPEEIKEEIKLVLENHKLIEEFGVDDWKWWEGNIKAIEYKNSKQLWMDIEEELREDLEKLEKIIREYKELIIKSVEKNDFSNVRFYNKLAEIFSTNKENILSQDIINFLSRKVFIPKYGFPVDVVSLDIIGHKIGSKLQLDRDLSIAISEYNPGESIIAKKHLIFSTNVKVYDGIEPQVYEFAYCKNCGYYIDDRKVEEELCPVCGFELRKGKFLIPLGFESKSLKLFNPENNFSNEAKNLLKEYIKEYDKAPVVKNPLKVKPINLTRVRTFFRDKSIDENQKIRETRKVYSIKITPYVRGEVTKIAISENKRVILALEDEIENSKKEIGGVSFSWLNENLRRKFEKEAFYIGHKFYTDILVIELPEEIHKEIHTLNSIKTKLSENELRIGTYYSLAYAFVEASSQYLDIQREDIDCLLKPIKEGLIYDIVIYDNVPAGAGFIEEIYENFEKILEKALDITKNCSCGEDTVCNNCLLHYTNQYMAHIMSRAFAYKMLTKLISQ